MASFRAALSERARQFLSERVDLDQALGFTGLPGRPSAPELASPVPGLGPMSTTSGGTNRRDRRAAAKLDTVAERARRRAARDVRYERRFARRMAEWGAEEPTGGWRGIGRDVWVMAWDCEADSTGHALRYWMRRERNKVALGAARAAALADGRTWHDPVARRIMALSLVQLRLAEPTPNRKGRFSGGIVRGVPLGAFAAMLAPPGASARIPHRNTISGRHRGAGSVSRRGQMGYLDELIDAGFCYSQQLPADEVEPFERAGWSGHACNRYWLLSPNPSSVQDQAEREGLIALHRAGQAVHAEQFERHPSSTAARARRRLGHCAQQQNAAETRAQQLRAAVLGSPPS